MKKILLLITLMSILMNYSGMAQIETPTGATNWWSVAAKNNGPYTYKGQSFDWIGGDACDFTIFKSKNGKWHIMSCIRVSKDPSNNVEVPRFFAHFETDDIRNPMWKKKDIFYLYTDWTRCSAQAPHCFKHNGKYYLAYNANQNTGLYVKAYMMVSEDGVNFSQCKSSAGTFDFFSTGRDLMFYHDPNGSQKWYAYHCANACSPSTFNYVGARTADSLLGPWSGGCANVILPDTGGVNIESPFLVLRGANDYYLWSQSDVRHSNDPLNFIGQKKVTMANGKYAPEVVEDNGEYFIAAYGNGIYIRRFDWKSSVGKDNNIYLKSLSASEGSFMPAFDSLRDNYVMVVPNNITTLTLNAIPVSSKSTITITNNSNLQIGKNIVAVKVNAENGLDKRIYTINVYRLATGEKTYKLTVNNGSSSGMYPAGAEFPVCANIAAAGQIFNKWSGDVDNIKYKDDYIDCKKITVIMPEKDITLNAGNINTITVTFKLIDKPSGNPIRGEIAFYGNYFFVSNTGTVVAKNVEPGILDLLVQKPYGVAGETYMKNINFTKDTTIIVYFPLETPPVKPMHNVTFIAKYKDTPVQNVAIIFNGQTLTTNSLGSIVFSGVQEGNPTYMVSCATYKNFWGGFSLTKDTTIIISILKQDEYELTIVNGSGSGIYKSGNSVNITANAPLPGYVFDHWEGHLLFVNDRNASAAVITMPPSSIGLKAVYKSAPMNTHTLTVVNGTGNGNYSAGTIVSIAANPPATGKVFDKWTGGTTGIANVNNASTTIIMPAANTSITATYKDAPVATYTLTVTSGTGSRSYSSGAKVAVAANAAPSGKVFDKWTGDVQYLKNTTDSVNEITMPAKNVSITATYKDKPIELQKSDLSISVYPNPSTEIVFITFKEKTEGTISIINAAGVVLIEADITTDETILNVSGWAKGVYVLKVITPQQTIERLLMVQ